MENAKIFCAVLDDTAVFPVDVDLEGFTVGDLKKEIKKQSKLAIKCDPSELQLFVGKPQGKAWVTVHDVENSLIDVKNLAEMKGADLTLSYHGLKGAVRARADLKIDEIAEGKGPVSMVAKDPSQSSWELVDTSCTVLSTDKQGSVLSIPEKYVDGSGIQVQGGALLLFQRQEVQDEWIALWTFVVKTFAALWIVGPLGTGNSSAAFAVACSLERIDGDEHWNVVWIHCSKETDKLSCIRFRGMNEKWTRTIDATELDSLLSKLRKTTVVFLDGYVNDRLSIVQSCQSWRKANKQGHRLVIVCSMVLVGKDWRPDLYGYIPSTVASGLKSLSIDASPESNPSEPGMLEQQLFKLTSWTLNDFKKAMMNDTFFEHVKAKFTRESEVDMPRRMELVEDKFFIGGGSARMMFDGNIEDAKASLLFGIHSIQDIEPSLDGTIGVASPNVINRLFSWYWKDQDWSDQASMPEPSIVSSFAAREIGLRLGPAKVQALARCLARNPAMNGHLFELWFFSSLVHGGAQCYTMQNQELCKYDVWESNSVERFDPEKGNIPMNGSEQWLAPRMWNQGGYDAVFIKLESPVKVRWICHGGWN